MNRKWIYKAAVGLLPLALLAGCGDGTPVDGGIVSTVAPVAVNDELPGTEAPQEETVEVGLEYRTGALTAETEALVLEAMTTLHQNLEIPEYLGEGIHLVSDAVWLETMSQEVYEGSRNYFLQRGEELLLSVQVGLDIEGKVSVNVFYPGEEDGVLVLKQDGNVTWLLQTAVSGGKYEGGFETWKLDSGTGHILREQGTYSAGVMVGEYVKSEYQGEPGDVFDMWTNRENFEYQTATQWYDEAGQPTTAPTPEPTATPIPSGTAQPTQGPSSTPKPTQRPSGTPKPTNPPSTPAPTNPPTQPPATPKPTDPPSTPTPTNPPTQPPATPKPTDPPSTPAPTNPPTQPPSTPKPTDPPSTPAPTPQPSEGDTDIEWSPDLM